MVRHKRNPDLLAWFWVSLLAIVLAFTLNFLKTGKVWAHEEHEPHAAWYKSQVMNPETKARLGVAWKSCCDHADVYKTRFRLVAGGRYGTETYEYLRDGKWKVVEADIIQRKPTPDGQPVLFINKHDGRELCLILDEGGI